MEVSRSVSLPSPEEEKLRHEKFLGSCYKFTTLLAIASIWICILNALVGICDEDIILKYIVLIHVLDPFVIYFASEKQSKGANVAFYYFTFILCLDTLVAVFRYSQKTTDIGFAAVRIMMMIWLFLQLLLDVVIMFTEASIWSHSNYRTGWKLEAEI